MSCRSRIAFSLVLAGCVIDAGVGHDAGSSSGSTSADGSSDTGTNGGGRCDHHPMVLGDPLQVGLTGVSASDVLAAVAGTYTGAIAWMADTPAHYQGSTDPSALTLEIRHDGGEIRSIDAVLVEDCIDEGPCPCEDSLEIDVVWRLVSADGVLAERWNAPLVHQPGSFVMATDIGISHELQPDDTEGTLAASSFAPVDGWLLQRLVAQSELDDGNAQGTISTELERLGAIGYLPAATFTATRD